MLDEREPRREQRRRRCESAPGGATSRLETAKLQPEPDARPSPRNVVLEIGVQRLEAAVQVGRQRNQHQLDLESVKAERAGQPPEPEVGARGLGYVRLSLHPRQESGGLLVGGGRGGREGEQT